MDIQEEMAERHIAFLAAHPLFQRISRRSRALREFLGAVALRRFAKGDLVYVQHQPPSFLYLVRDGEIHIEHRDPQTNTSTLVGIEGRGAVFGEVSLLSGEPRSSNARAALDSLVYLIPGEAFLKLLSEEGSVSQALTLLLSKRLRSSITGEGSDTPARVIVLIGPEDPLRASQIARDLADTLVDNNPDRVALCAFGKESLVEAQAAPGATLAQVMDQWPQITIDAIRDLLETQHLRYDVLRGDSLHIAEQRHERIADRIPALLGRLRKYYSLILVDVGRNFMHPAISSIIEQSDSVVFLRPVDSDTSTDSRVSDYWREATAHCTAIMPEFFARVVTVSDESFGTTTAQLNAVINRDSALYKNHFRLQRDAPGVRDQQGRLYKSSLDRLARRLSGSSRGLVLGGGGARAFAHIGVLEVLEREGIEFDAISGTSMGAVVGAAYALGNSPHEIGRMLARILPNSAAVMDKVLPLISFYRGRKLGRALLRGFGEKRFEDTLLPFVCNGADLNSGRQIIFERGFLATALRASVSLPGVFPPVRMGNLRIVDGGVINNLPGEILRDRGHAVVLGVNVTPMADERSSITDVQRERGAFGFLRGLRNYLSVPPILNIVYRAITMEGRELIRLRMDAFDHVLEPNVGEFDVFDFQDIDRIVDRGRQAAQQNLPEIREILATKRI